MTGTLAGLQGISLRANNASCRIQFPIENDRERRMLALLNRVAEQSNMTITLAASASTPLGMRDLCEKLDAVVQTSNLREPEKFQVREFLAKQRLRAKREAIRRG